MSFSPEYLMTTEALAHNQNKMDGYFGDFFGLMRKALVAGGSELGLGMTLFSLAVSIRATRIIEIGRFKGFSTLCLASALRFIDIGWQEPQQHKQRPDVDYSEFEAPKKRQLLSIDPFPTKEAEELILEANLENYVEFINARSDEVTIDGLVDLIFIDGDHSYEGCKADVFNYVPWYLRPGGYFILHDYYGWYDSEGNNNSPVKQVIDELIAEELFEHILIDTGYQSFTVFRNPNP
ncbi:class I SAM-dependent methyltransferase [Thermosynechococcus sichuanensis E542]|uniref:Class I SAM-dependent methyltransferase n=2 Tax=Thermosynechococcus TaxID=146785 RepID=A0A3B7MFU8_9CYAN|nr:class I SAM-dependent methyltransferase [Thermosynechococcus vestitus]AXY68498.1 class I SAM-dependent methyltransferase [Thermosynechococcus vestitus E542]